MSNFDLQGTNLSGNFISCDVHSVFQYTIWVMFDGVTLAVYDINNDMDNIILHTECDKMTEVRTICEVEVALT
jgi:hypothetical protein